MCRLVVKAFLDQSVATAPRNFTNSLFDDPMSARIHCLVTFAFCCGFCPLVNAQDRSEFTRIIANQPTVLATRPANDDSQSQRELREAGANRGASIEFGNVPSHQHGVFRNAGYQDPNESSTGRFPRNNYLQEPDRRAGIGATSQSVDPLSGITQDRLSVGEIKNGKLYLNNCTVLFIDDVKLPARESGQIIQLNVKEGDAIQANQLLAQLDDKLFKIQEQRLKFSYENANDKAEDMTTIEAHNKEVELQQAKLKRTTNLYQQGSQNLADLQIARFEYDLAMLKVKAAENARKAAAGEARMELAQMEEIQQRIERHKIFVDFDGYVIELLKQKQEWANAGEPVMRAARMDRLAVQAIVGTKVVDPHRIRSQQNVVVTLQMADGKSEQFQGKISNVSLVRETGTLIKIRAEVENRKIGDQSWLLQPLSVVEMVVDLNIDNQSQ
jgi:hypothetical protein